VVPLPPSLRHPSKANARKIWLDVVNPPHYYFMPNLMADLKPDSFNRALRAMWDKCQGQYGLSVTSIYHSFLFLFGSPGCGSPFHVDQTSAVNVGWLALERDELETREYNDIISVWYFLNPQVLLHDNLRDIFEDVCEQETGHRNIFALQRDAPPGEGKVLLPHSCMVSLQETLGHDMVIIMYQPHNHVVVVPPGWAHQVLNLRLGLKAAFDTLDGNKLFHYARNHRDILCPCVGEGNVQDYRDWAYEIQDKLGDIF
jgi:hypothetical protein